MVLVPCLQPVADPPFSYYTQPCLADMLPGFLMMLKHPFCGDKCAGHREDRTPSSSRLETLQSLTTTISILSSVAGTIPLAGPAIKGALEALHKVLLLIEVSDESEYVCSQVPDTLACPSGTTSGSRRCGTVVEQDRAIGH